VNITHYLKRFHLAEGGVVRAVLDLAGALAPRGHHVTVLTWDDTDIPADWKAARPGCPHVRLIPRPSRPLGLWSPSERRAVAAALDGTDVAHLHAMWEPTNAQLASLCRNARIPYIHSIHGMLDDWSMAQRPLKKNLYLALAERRTLSKAFAYHCTAQGELDQAKRYARAGRGVVVPLVFDVSAFASSPGPDLARTRHKAFSAGEPVLLFLSRLHVKKGVEHLIRAVKLLRDSGTPCRAIVAGSGDDAYAASLRALVTQLGLSDVIDFPGLVVGPDKVSLFEAADLFVLPTSQENFGFVLVEALAAGTPVITTRGVDIWPELDATGAAWIVDQTPDAIAHAVRTALADRPALAAKAAAARAWALAEFSGDAIVRRYEALYADTRTPRPT
jgi:glycosyltransferase involved in cell wall biosynthesis